MAMTKEQSDHKKICDVKGHEYQLDLFDNKYVYACKCGAVSNNVLCQFENDPEQLVAEHFIRMS